MPFVLVFARRVRGQEAVVVGGAARWVRGRRLEAYAALRRGSGSGAEFVGRWGGWCVVVWRGWGIGELGGGVVDEGEVVC